MLHSNKAHVTDFLSFLSNGSVGTEPPTKPLDVEHISLLDTVILGLEEALEIVPDSLKVRTALTMVQGERSIFNRESV